VMNIYLIDGTYELFRHFFALPSAKDSTGQEIAAVRGVLSSVLSMIESGDTHLGVATDHVVESFRNDLYPGYKTAEGVPPELLSQFPILEEALQAMGVLVWPMVEFEADDALASAAAKAAKDEHVTQVIICTPDKDLSQCVTGTRIVQLDRRQNALRNEAGVIEKFGVEPASIPDYLAVVGDSADGFPGVAGWGAKAASAVLSHFTHLEKIPQDWRQWPPSIRRSSHASRIAIHRMGRRTSLSHSRNPASGCSRLRDRRRPALARPTPGIRSTLPPPRLPQPLQPRKIIPSPRQNELITTNQTVWGRPPSAVRRAKLASAGISSILLK
jgi:5'-3' exonuclease